MRLVFTLSMICFSMLASLMALGGFCSLGGTVLADSLIVMIATAIAASWAAGPTNARSGLMVFGFVLLFDSAWCSAAFLVSNHQVGSAGAGAIIILSTTAVGLMIDNMSRRSLLRI